MAYAGFENPYAPHDEAYGEVVAIPSPKPGADRILEVTISPSSQWQTNQILELDVLALPIIYTGLDQSNDYSYAAHGELTEWDRFTVTVGGVPVWGTPP